jgi:hypothetical protein
VLLSKILVIESLDPRFLFALDVPVLLDATIMNRDTVPQGISVSINDMATKIRLASAVPGATGILLERSSDGVSNWQSQDQHLQIPPGLIDVYNTNNLSGQKFYFRVRATNGAETSAYSNVISPRTSFDNVVQAEIDITQSSSTTAKVVWPVNPLANAYHVDVLVGGTTWQNVASQTSGASTSTGILVTGVDWSTGLTFRVRRIEQPNSATFIGYCRATNGLSATHFRGDVVSVIDEAMIDPNLPVNAISEVERFKLDLIGEGWRVHSIVVARDFDDYRPISAGGQG